jgi:cell division transport system ATP-binding protein
MVRALMTSTNILIADEPTAILDKESSIKLFDFLNFYNVKRKLTVVWASHNRELVKQFPGKIVHLENGKLVYSGHACFI